MANLRPGDFGLVPVGGQVGQLIRWGQWLNGDGFADFEHAFIWLGDSKGNIVEAEPGGAKLTPCHYGNNVVWSSGYLDLTGVQRDAIVKAAIGYVGTPYSFLDYFALAAKRLHIPHWLLDRYIKSSKHMICSQLVAKCYADAGAPLFGEFSGDVTPGDLYQLLKAKGLH